MTDRRRKRTDTVNFFVLKPQPNTYFRTIIGLATFAQNLTDQFLFWVPLYYEAKLALVVFLWHPKVNGATYVYESTLQPWLAQHEPYIDSKMEETKNRVQDFTSRYLKQ